MSNIAIIDLTESKDLDRQAMTELTGGFYGGCGWNPCGPYWNPTPYTKVSFVEEFSFRKEFNFEQGYNQYPMYGPYSHQPALPQQANPLGAMGGTTLGTEQPVAG